MGLLDIGVERFVEREAALAYLVATRSDDGQARIAEHEFVRTLAEVIPHGEARELSRRFFFPPPVAEMRHTELACCINAYKWAHALFGRLAEQQEALAALLQAQREAESRQDAERDARFQRSADSAAAERKQLSLDRERARVSARHRREREALRREHEQIN